MHCFTQSKMIIKSEMFKGIWHRGMMILQSGDHIWPSRDTEYLLQNDSPKKYQMYNWNKQVQCFTFIKLD
jgi:hypothetical protein